MDFIRAVAGGALGMAGGLLVVFLVVGTPTADQATAAPVARISASN